MSVLMAMKPRLLICASAGLIYTFPRVWDSGPDEVSSTFQPPKLGAGGKRAAPSPASLCILCCCGTDCSMHFKIPHQETGLMILILQSFTANTQWLFLQFWVCLFERHPKKSHFQSHLLCCHCCAECGVSPCPQSRRHCQAPFLMKPEIIFH